LGFILVPVPTPYARAFARAAEILGGAQALSDYLKVPRYEVMQWIRGAARPSERAFLEVVELLADADPQAFAAEKRSPRPPKGN